MSAWITGQLPNVPHFYPVKYLTQSVCFIHWSIIKCKQNQDIIPNVTQINSVEYLTQAVSFNQQLISKCTQNPLGKIANTECLI